VTAGELQNLTPGAAEVSLLYTLIAFFTSSYLMFDSRLLPDLYPCQTLKHALIDWRELYSKKDVEACLAKLECVSFEQPRELLNTLRATALSGGLAIGSANWLIESADRKVVYLGGSSKLTGPQRHPQPLALERLGGVDAVLLAGLNPESSLPPPEDALARMCRHIGKTLNRGGNVLIPTGPTGLVYDMLEQIIPYLASIGLQATPQ